MWDIPDKKLFPKSRGETILLKSFIIQNDWKIVGKSFQNCTRRHMLWRMKWEKVKKKKGFTTLYPRGFSYNVSGIESEINIWSSEVT